MNDVEERLRTELVQLADALLEQHETSCDSIGRARADGSEHDLIHEAREMHRPRRSKILAVAASVVALAGIGYVAVDAFRTEETVLAQGFVADSAADVPVCPQFDEAELTALSFAGTESGVLIGAWSTEAERFIGLCTDSVEAALEAAGIDFTTRTESGSVSAERDENNSITVRLVSEGGIVIAASID